MRELFALFESFTIPSGATSGTRIEFDGVLGEIRLYNEADELVGYLSPDLWFIGPEMGARVTIDPTGGIRIRNADDGLVSTIDQQGYTLRDTESGIVLAEIKPGTIRLVDPIGTDDIELTTDTADSLPNPKYTSAPELNPGASIAVPSAALFTPDDFEIYHGSATRAGTNQAGSYTVPAGTTERVDTSHNAGTSSLLVGVATRDPASGIAADFTADPTTWTHGIGSHVIVRGGGATSPSFQSVSEDTFGPTTATSLVLSLAPPSGTLTGRVLVAFVSMLNTVGGVPISWKAPDGWVFLGANAVANSSGPTLSTAAVGVWAKLGTASEPAEYDVPIQFGPGTKWIHACIVAVADPFLIEGGAHIRIAGHPIRRLLGKRTLDAAAQTLADFQNIPQGFDHLEIIYDGESDIGGDIARPVQIRFNSDTGNNYHRQVISDGAITGALNTSALRGGMIDGQTAAHRTSGQLTVFDYAAATHERSMVGHCTWVGNINLLDDSVVGYWNNQAAGINRVVVQVDVGGGGIVKFAAGSRAFLYGY